MNSADKSRAIALWLQTQSAVTRADFMNASIEEQDPWTLLTKEQRSMALGLYKSTQQAKQKARVAQTAFAPITMTTPDRVIHIKGDTYTIVPQAPIVNVTIPQQPAPIVNVEAAPAPVVNIAPADVTVNVPEAKATLPQDIRIISMPERTVSQVVVRDPQGRVAGLETVAD